MSVLDRLLNRNPEPKTNGVDDMPEQELLPPEYQHHAKPTDAKLVVHAGAVRIAREDLDFLDTPPPTDTFQPIAHSRLINELEEALAFRHIKIIKGDFAITPDGMKLFSLLELDSEYEGVRFAIGLRNSNDKSMRLGMVAGYRVFICDNMALSGDFKPLLAKHSKNFELTEALSIGVDRIQRGFDPLRKAIDFKRTHQLHPTVAQASIYRAFMVHKFPVNLMKHVHKAYFKSDEEQTLWHLENAFTSSFKRLTPVRHYEVTAKLGKFIGNFQERLQSQESQN